MGKIFKDIFVIYKDISKNEDLQYFEFIYERSNISKAKYFLHKKTDLSFNWGDLAFIPETAEDFLKALMETNLFKSKFTGFNNNKKFLCNFHNDLNIAIVDKKITLKEIIELAGKYFFGKENNEEIQNFKKNCKKNIKNLQMEEIEKTKF